MNETPQRNAEQYAAGAVVWAPYAGGEYRLRVVATEGDRLVLKAPGSDAGVVTVEAAKCYPSGAAPHGLEDVNRATDEEKLVAAIEAIEAADGQISHGKLEALNQALAIARNAAEAVR